MTLRSPPIPVLSHDHTVAGAIANRARIGSPVVGNGQWYQLAMNINWLLAHGSQLAWWSSVGAIAAGSEETITSWCWPRYGNRVRCWTICMHAPGAFGRLETPTYPSTDGLPWACGSDAAVAVVNVIEVLDAAPDETGEEITANIHVNSNSPGATIFSVTCSELPIGKLTGQSGYPYGLRQRSCLKGHPIFEYGGSGAVDAGLRSVSATSGAAIEWALRSGAFAARRKIFDWSLAAGFATTSTSYVNMMRVPPSGQARHLYAGETSRDMDVQVLASVSGGTGDVRIQAIDTFSASVSSTTPAWHSGTLELPTDDLGQDDWLRSGAHNELVVEARKNTSGTLTVYAIAIGESG